MICFVCALRREKSPDSRPDAIDVTMSASRLDGTRIDSRQTRTSVQAGGVIKVPHPMAGYGTPPHLEM